MATKTKAKTKTAPRTTKKGKLIKMLSTKAGADVEAISSKLGWQSHTTRAAITMLKKAGFEVGAEKERGKPTRYRIVSEPQAVASGGDEVAAPDPATAAEQTNAG